MAESPAARKKREAAEEEARAQAEAALAGLSDEDRAVLAELSEDEVTAIQELAAEFASLAAQEQPVEVPAPQPPIVRLDAAQAALGAIEQLYSSGKATAADVDAARTEVTNARAAIRG